LFGRFFQAEILGDRQQLLQVLTILIQNAAEAIGQDGTITLRDIKPSNIIFANGVPKLADIGLVTSIGHKSYRGTEGYIAPEGPGKEQADIYSLGKVLYELSTGKDRLDFPVLPTDLADDMLKLNPIILMACQNDLRKRYESALQMHNDLVRLQGLTL